MQFPATWLRVRHGARRTVDQARAESPRAAVLVDGPMFSPAGAVTEWTLRDRQTGASVAGTRAREGVVLLVEAGRARVARPPAPDSADVVVGLWPPLVEASRVVATDVGTNRERVWRVGVGATSTGDVVVVAHVGPMTGLARELVAAGAVGAGYTDGGSSSAVWVAGHGVVPALSAAPRVPAWIAAEPPAGVAPPPVPSAPGAPWGAVGAVAGGLALAAIMRLARRRARTR